MHPMPNPCLLSSRNWKKKPSEGKKESIKSTKFIHEKVAIYLQRKTTITRMHMIQLSLFRGVHDTQPRPVTLEEVVTMMRTDQSVRDLTEKHRYARSTGDEQGASRYKKMMTSFGVAALFEGGRRQQHIVELTGLSLVDIDHIPTERMSEVLALVRGDEHTLLAYTTLSGHGVRILFRYQINENVNGYPLRSVSQCSTPLVPLKEGQCSLDSSIAERSSSEPAEYRTNQKELSPFKGDERNEVKRNGAEGVKQYAALYKLVFIQGNEYYSNLLNLPYDGQCKNVGRISTIAYDEELYYNPEATPFIIEPEEKKSVGRPRKGKSEEVRVKRCEDAVLRDLERRGVVYAPGTHNKYISDACYMMNRYGVSESDCTAWALEKFADYQAEGNDVASIVRSCYQQTEEHGTAKLPRRRQSNQATVADIQRFLTESGVRVRYNVITRKREILVEGLGLSVESSLRDVALPDANSLNSKPSTFNQKELTDDHVNSLYCRFCLSTGLTTRPKEFNTIIESDFYPTYNPLHEYLEHLPAWDGVTDHIDRLASMVHVTGCTQDMHNRFFKKWIVAMVAAWMDESVTNHEILTYIGPQGRYKTTFMTRLLPPVLGEYFATKTFKGRMDKDDRLALTELALIDLEELDVMNASEVNQLKALVTDPSVNLRPVYARYTVRRAHIASFCGTGNNPRFLTDLTGHRRWLPFMIEAIDSPYDHPFDYEGIYAQAYALYRNGFRYWFDDEENAELERHNRQFEEPCIEEELIRTYLRKPYGEERGEFLTATRIIELVGGAVRVTLSPKRIAIAMQRLGYEQRRVLNTRGWNVVILTGDQIKEQQRMDAHRSVEE